MPQSYQLRVANPAGLAQPLVQGLIQCWQHSYARMARRFNPAAPGLVTLTLDSHLQAQGLTLGAEIRISSVWITHHPHDLDVMTHEQFHVVQNYGPGSHPGWAVEGLADYARARYGLSNQGWSLPPRQPGQHFTDSYRVTARFFLWLEKHRRPTFPQELDSALRDRSYTPQFWTDHFGHTVEQLWYDYATA